MSSNDEELLIVEQLDKLDEWRPPIESAVDGDNDKVLDVRDSNDNLLHPNILVTLPDLLGGSVR